MSGRSVLLIVACCCLTVLGDDAVTVKLGDGAGRLAELSAEVLAKLPAELLHLVQADKLSSLPGVALAAVARTHKQDSVLVGKCALASRTKKQQEEFLQGLKEVVLLPERVQFELASCMVHWFRDIDEEWKFERFFTATHIGSPLLAYLPREFLYSLDRNTRDKFLYHLRAWSWATSREAEWAHKPRGLQRSWAETMVLANFPAPLDDLSFHDITLQGFLLTGMTPDELSKLKLKFRESREHVLRLPFDYLQMRFLFRGAFPRRSNRLLTVPHDIVAKVMTLLTPAQLRGIDFSKVNSSQLGTVSLSSKFPPPWATALQLAYTLSKEAEVLGFVSSAQDAATWGISGLRHVARFAYALPTSQISRMINSNPFLLDDVLSLETGHEVVRALDESPLSYRQARLLLSGQLNEDTCSNASKAAITVVGMAKRLKGRLLMALSANCLALAPASELPQTVLTHLIAHVPSSSPAAFPLYLKIWAILNRDWVLGAMLDNTDSAGFLKFFSTTDITPIAMDLRDAIARQSPIEPLPQDFLRLVLGHWRRTLEALDKGWRGSMVHVPALLPGMRCKDLRKLGTEEGLPVLSALGQYVQNSGAEYPRDLQHCGLTALLEYLATRARLQERPSTPLLDTLEPAEIDAIGGYIFARLPASIIGASSNWQHIIRAIGRLSILELLEIWSAEGNESSSKAIAITHIALERLEPELHGLASLELLGNLIQFVPYSEQLANKLDMRAFRLWVEGMQRRQDTALCVPQSTRLGFWYRVIREAYGSPSSWSAGTLANLGGLLSAIPTDKLLEVHRASWIEAADVLNKQNGYSQRFMQACSRFLGPDEAYQFSKNTLSLLRYFMEASNNLTAIVRAPKDLSVVGGTTTTSPPTIIAHKSLSIPVLKVLGARDRRDVNETEVETAESAVRAVASGAVENTLSGTQIVSNSSNGPVQHNTSEIHTEEITSVAPEIDEASITTTPVNLTISTPPPITRKLRCGALRMAEQASSMILDESDLLALVNAGELEECLEVLGSLHLPAPTVNKIWDLIKKHNISVDIRDLGALLSQVDMELLRHSNLRDLDVVTMLGRYMDNWEHVGEVAQLVLEAYNVTEVMSDELGGALGTLTCGFFDISKDLARQLIRPELFLKISAVLAHTLGSTSRCPPFVCLRGLANIATGPLVMGDPAGWNSEEISGLGIIAAGLTPQQAEILYQDEDGGSASGISADAIRCMPLETLNAMSVRQLSKLRVTSLDMISSRHLEFLLPQQRSTLLVAKSPPNPDHLLCYPSEGTAETSSAGPAMALIGSTIFLIFVIATCFAVRETLFRNLVYV